MSKVACAILAVCIVLAALCVLMGACYLITRAWASPDRLWKRIARPAVTLITVGLLAFTAYLITLVICGLH